MAISLPLDWLRGLQSAWLPDVATIRRYTETSTPDGIEHAWTDVATDVPCRVSPLASQAVEGLAAEGAVLRGVSSWVIWLQALTDVTVKDRLVVAGADRADGRTFEVERVGERSYETARECVCRLLS